MRQNSRDSQRKGPMKIKSVKIWREDFELSRPYTIAFRTVTHVSNLLVELTSECGVTGFGAGSPEKFVTGESFELCWEAANNEIEKILVGQDIEPELFETLYQKMSRTPAACAAADMALWDLLAKKKKVPLCTLFGEKIKELPTSITIGIKPVNEVVEEAKEYMTRGFQIIKLKLGKNLEEDIERTRQLRQTIGADKGIRVDLNQGYQLHETISYFEKTRDLNIEFVEQPLKKELFKEIQKAPVKIRKRIAADETLQSPTDAELLVTPQPWCGIFNIKLMKSGGITAARKIAATAEAHQVSLMWGCMDESRISISAALHTAFASPATKYIDLDGHLDLGRDLVDGGFLLKDGMMRLNNAIGLGCHYL